MPASTSKLFDFLMEHPFCSIERFEIDSGLFGDLRSSLRFLIINLGQCDDLDGKELSDRLRSKLSEWLTVPVPFNDSIAAVLKSAGEPEYVESRWGREISNYFRDASLSAQSLREIENPVRMKVSNLIAQLRDDGRSFRIYCHKRASEHFQSLCQPSHLSRENFIHSIAEYRDSDPFDVLLKVGPLRSRGWGAAPDAILTAPRFVTLMQVIWAGCKDEPGFGYDPVSALNVDAQSDEDTSSDTNRFSASLKLGWNVQENKSRDNSVGRFGSIQGINEFELFTNCARATEVQRATLVQIDEGHGILFPPHSRILSMNPLTHVIEYRSLGESLAEGMFLILPVVNDSRLAGLQAEDGSFSRIWKRRLKEEHNSTPNLLQNRLWDAGLMLLHLGSRINHWCKPSTTVIHAPQSMEHFEILIKTLGIDFESTVPALKKRGEWWQYAWDEIRRARGEAIQTGFQEQQIIDEQLLEALDTLEQEILNRVDLKAFQLEIPADQQVRGVFKFYKIVAIEEGLQVPSAELRMICELSRIDQWRV